MAALPPDILKNLAKAIEVVNMDLIAETLDAVKTHNEPLADALKQLIDDFEYDRITALIQDTETSQ